MRMLFNRLSLNELLEIPMLNRTKTENNRIIKLRNQRTKPVLYSKFINKPFVGKVGVPYVRKTHGLLARDNENVRMLAAKALKSLSTYAQEKSKFA